MTFKKALRKLWYFIWYDDSFVSWLVNLLLAFILVKFLVYPGIGFALQTGYPIVAVVSGSMEHNDQNFEDWWESREEWYTEKDIDEKTFQTFPYVNGFDKGDIMFLRGQEPKDIKIGDVVVYETPYHSNPIIHRVVVATEENGEYTFITKGDNNRQEDKPVSGQQLQNTGKAVFRVPYLGWIKIWFVQLISHIG